jgi:quinol monooxygenase YgiN
MPAPALHVIARSIARPDRVQEVQTLLQNLIEPSRKEKGCLKYVLLQNANHPTDFTAVEEWTDGEAYRGHLSSAHIQAALGKFGSLAAGAPDIRHYRAVGP